MKRRGGKQMQTQTALATKHGFDGKRRPNRHGRGRWPKGPDRFLSRVQKGQSCWLWIGKVDSRGYGVLAEQRAHRISYELNVGPIPDGLLVCHHCDNRLCVNPSHLFLGTHKDNSADMWSKGRQSPPPHPRGTAHPEAKLTPEIVRAIRAAPLTNRKTAADFGISTSLVANIRTRRAWSWVA